MPKRRGEDDYSHLERKLQKLERKIHRKKSKRRSHRARSPRSRTHSPCSPRRSASREILVSPTYPTQYGSEQEEPIASTSAQAGADVIAPGAAVVPPVSGCSAQSQMAATTSESTNIVASETVGLVSGLDDTILEILGIDPTQENVYGPEIQKELAIRLEHYACNGLSKENRKQLKEKYLVPSNCKLINAPVLNAELRAALSEAMANRDKAIEIKQTQLASAISALGQALTRMFSSPDKDAELIKILMDTSRMLCDCQYSDSVRRRGFVLSFLRKDIKDSLQTTTKIDNYLFGLGLAEALKTAKAVNKSSTELKAVPTAKPPVNKKPSANNARPLNWKGPIQVRRQPGSLRTKEPAATRYRQSSSSSQSQHRRQRNIRRQ